MSDAPRLTPAQEQILARWSVDNVKNGEGICLVCLGILAHGHRPTCGLFAIETAVAEVKHLREQVSHE